MARLLPSRPRSVLTGVLRLAGQDRARDNALAASTALLERRRERLEVEAFLALRATAARHPA